MGAERQTAARSARAGGRRRAEVRQLLPPGTSLPISELVAQLSFPLTGEPAGRPYVMLNMISTVDGRATLGGRSGPLGNRADRELFHGLRGVVDAVMAGAGTIRTERYGRIIADAGTRRRRRERGVSEEPLACIVSGRMALPADIPLLANPEARVAIITSSQAALPDVAAQVSYIRSARDGVLDLAAALRELRERFSVRMLLCEGGPHLNAHLFAGGLVDELFLSVAPKVAAGEPATDEALRIVAGPALQEAVELRLLALLESESYLFARYGVRSSASERASRETTFSSSPAR